MDFSGTDCVNGTVNICEIHGNSCPNRLIDMKNVWCDNGLFI